jgi:hypothetical protein
MLHPGTMATGVVLSQGAHGPNEPTPWGGSSQSGPKRAKNHAVQLATLPAQGASETEKKPKSRYKTPSQEEAGETAIKEQPGGRVDGGP